MRTGMARKSKAAGSPVFASVVAGIGDTLNRLQVNKYNGLAKSISKVARRVARFLRPLQTLGASAKVRHSEALGGFLPRKNSLSFAGLKIKYRRSNNPTFRPILVQALTTEIHECTFALFSFAP